MLWGGGWKSRTILTFVLCCILLVLLEAFGDWGLILKTVMASQRLFLAPFVSVWFKGQIGKLVSSSFLKRRMKNTWLSLPFQHRPVWLQFDLAPFLLYREPSKILFSGDCKVFIGREVPYPFKETANISLQTKEKLQLF